MLFKMWADKIYLHQLNHTGFLMARYCWSSSQHRYWKMMIWWITYVTTACITFREFGDIYMLEW